jgi:hypothetical protein
VRDSRRYIPSDACTGKYALAAHKSRGITSQDVRAQMETVEFRYEATGFGLI